MRVRFTVCVLGLVLGVGAICVAQKSGDDIADLIASAPSSKEFPNSGGVVLLDEASRTVEADGTGVTRFRRVIKLFDERARDLAEILISFNAAHESFRLLGARTHTAAGAVLEVDPSAIYETSQFAEYPAYECAKYVSFSLPGISDDCVIDVEWEIETTNSAIPRGFWDGWSFQDDIPVVRSVYRLDVPEQMDIHWRAVNCEVQPDTSVSNGRRTFVWEMRNLPKFDPEPLMLPQWLVSPYVEMSSVDHWESIGEWFAGIGYKSTSDFQLPPEVAEELADDADLSEWAYAEAVYRWVTDTYVWLPVYLSQAECVVSPAQKTMLRLYGDAKDLCAVLVAALQRAGIEAKFALLLDREGNVKPEAVPSLYEIVDVVVAAELDGKRVWMDPAGEMLPLGALPDADEGRRALVVARDGSVEYTRLPWRKSEEHGFTAEIKGDLDDVGTLNAEVRISFRGSSANAMRLSLRYSDPEEVGSIPQALAYQLGAGAKVLDYSLSDHEDLSHPVRLKMNVEIEEFAQKVGDRLVFSPRFSAAGARSPFDREERKYDLYYESVGTVSLHAEIAIPEGFQVQGLPEERTGESEFTKYSQTVRAEERRIIVDAKSTSQRARLPRTEYKRVREFVNRALQMNLDRVVLIRK